MCYSAQVVEAYDEYTQQFGADIDIETFAQLYGMKLYDNRFKTTPALDQAIKTDGRPKFVRVREKLAAYQQTQLIKLNAELEAQEARLVQAEASLQKKITKKALEDQRIAVNKIARAKVRIAELKDVTAASGSSRMFPGHYVPVMIMENGKKLVRLMRYQCRIAGVPENFDQKYPGTYNARMDNLDVYWRNQFGYTHGIVIVSAFYEYVVGPTGENIVLEFKPSTGEQLYVACLWSHWTAPGKDDLLSFAFITDDPPPEVLAAGHDRCIVPIKRENVDAWLNADPSDLDSLYDILQDRVRPYYEHKVSK